MGRCRARSWCGTIPAVSPPDQIVTESQSKAVTEPAWPVEASSTSVTAATRVALSRVSTRGVNCTLTRRVPMQTSPGGRGRQNSRSAPQCSRFGGRAVAPPCVSQRQRSAVPRSSTSWLVGHSRTASAVSRLPLTRPDLEPKTAVLLCRVEPEAADGSSGRFLAAPGRPNREQFGRRPARTRLPLQGRVAGVHRTAAQPWLCESPAAGDAIALAARPTRKRASICWTVTNRAGSQHLAGRRSPAARLAKQEPRGCHSGSLLEVVPRMSASLDRRV
jgi:hypothetical protein